MLVTHTERPRELKWYHAGPMLYGDWGTSRFYVLGLAFYYTLHASFWYVLGVGAIVAAVGWAYTVICRCYPDGGGVYSAARHTSKQLAVIGALLLFADYIVTAAISAYSGMQYLNISNNATALALASTGLIALIGLINYVGARKAGTFALIVAMATLVLTLIIGVFAVPELHTGWLKIVSFRSVPGSGPERWDNLVRVILALSGVEAVANMTGIMVPPVTKTSKKSIYPVLFEVVVLNLLFAVAMNALPDAGARPAAEYEAAYNKITSYEHWETNPEAQKIMAENNLTPERINRDQDIENTVMRVMATDYVGKHMGVRVGNAFGWICGIVFGLLLFSAVNTAVMDMISIQYVMSRDTELPRFIQRLNRFGVPWLALVPAVVLPSILVIAFPDLVTLGDLYAIGVIGAITINLGSCSTNRTMPLKMYERIAMGLLAAILLAVELTLVWEKPKARWFALAVVVTGLTLRYAAKAYPRWKAKWKKAAEEEVMVLRPAGGVPGIEVPVPDMSLPKVLVATRGGDRLIEFAAKYAKRLNGVLMVLFVRQINIVQIGPDRAMSIEEDPGAQGIFRKAAEICAKEGVAMVPIYVTSPDVAFAILDHAATYDVESVLMGVSREGTILRALKGDVLTAVADNLPADIPLLIHA